MAEAHCIEHAAQKARKIAEAKTKEKTEKWRLAKENKRKQLKYL